MRYGKRPDGQMHRSARAIADGLIPSSSRLRLHRRGSSAADGEPRDGFLEGIGMRSKALALCASIGVLAWAGAARAQTAPEAPAADEPSQLGEIIVTAQKRSESLQRTPVAVSAFTSETLEQQQINGVQQLQYNVPSLVFAQLTGYSQLSMRGIGSDLTVTAGEPTVATFQDGVYMGQLFAQSVPSFDLERIEVLRGPQGTLYGRNSTGGTINYITKPPSYDTAANLAFTYGNYDRVAVEAGATGAIVPDKVAARVSVKYDRRDGYRFNVFDGKRYDANDHLSGQAALLIEPSSDIKLTLRGDMSRQVTSAVQQFIDALPTPSSISPETPTGIFSLPGTALAGIPGLLSPSDLALLGNRSISDLFGLSEPGLRGGDPTKSTRIANDFPSRTEVNLRGVSATLDWDIGNVSLKSITAYRFSKLFIQTDNDGSSAAILYEDPIQQTSKQFTQEVNISGKAFDDRLDWLAGVFYLHDRASLKADIYLPSLGDLIIASASLGTAAPPPVFDLSQPLIPNLLLLGSDPLLGNTLYGGQPTPVAFLGFGAEQKSSSLAGFGQVTYRIADRLRVTAGLRYTRDEKDVFRRLHSNFVPTAALCETQSKKSWTAWTGTAGVDFDLSDRAMLYGKVSRGYKAGGFNPAECTGSFNPEILWSYEAGLKSTLADNQLRVNLAGFYYDFSDIQFTTYLNNSSTIRNAADATLYGIEAEYMLAPRGLAGFSLDGSGSWIHSEYGSQLLQDPLGLATLDIKGNRLIRAPEWKLNFGAQQRIETANAGAFTLRGEAAYTSQIFHDVFNGEAPFQSQTREAPYWILNARLSWSSPGDRFQAQLFAENITNKLYAYSRVAAATGAYVSGQFSPPRTYGIRLSMKLGAN